MIAETTERPVQNREHHGLAAASGTPFSVLLPAAFWLMRSTRSLASQRHGNVALALNLIPVVRGVSARPPWRA
ncbi:hypothetical protein L6654_07655 [Bradyrhizobium sp. WYCCWR 13023]|uniref:Uncharacterized protein n=1 Tax=Bradyrhizobium zhengyangense TaxID=2911009 RepID=A0A9X1R632_9BRAD|nr:hypothetical protein [Bradyrhizobium zhengyangense]MCG2626496.1 hypothetical protein [Bradyrhizobium zhengyangense]MCG2640451.1 hypothetical protein [Bradyrhizobium zhengyangense]